MKFGKKKETASRDDGGDVIPAFKKAMERGVCLESDFPSEFSGKNEDLYSMVQSLESALIRSRRLAAIRINPISKF